jgi:hypothetical protein
MRPIAKSSVAVAVSSLARLRAASATSPGSRHQDPLGADGGGTPGSGPQGTGQLRGRDFH